jgi:heat shock protein HslJ
MRRQRLVAAVGAVLVVLSLASCVRSGDTDDQGAPDPQLRGQWLLTDAKDEGGPINLLHQYLTLTIDRDKTTGGRSSCSSYTASVFGTPDSLWVQATLPRQTDCGTAAQQALEFRYIADLDKIRAATVRGDDLHLTADDVDLHFVQVTPSPLKPIVDRFWYSATLTPLSLNTTDTPVSYIEPGASIRFGGDGTLTAVTGCGVIAAHYVENAGEIVSTDVTVNTRTTCDGYDDALDDYLVRLIDSGFTFTANARELTLTSKRALLRLGLSVEAAT